MQPLTKASAFLFAACGLVLGVCAGCAASSSTSAGFEQVMPAAYQPGPVQMNTIGGYDILYSEGANSSASVSLRSGTEDYFQFFVSAFNRENRSVQVGPEQVRLRFGGSKRTVRVYSPAEVPQRIANDAKGDIPTAAELTDLTGRLYADENVDATEESSAYGGDDESEQLSSLLLTASTLNPKESASGFVYAPVPKGQAGQFVIEVEVGSDRHRFRYTFQ